MLGNGAALANVFVDEPYRRSNFTLVSLAPDDLAAAAIRISRLALEILDLSSHEAFHPRLGAVDHISCHALTDWNSETAFQTGRAACDIAQKLGQGPTAVPTYLYGSAHPEGRKLADIRRRLGYFKGNKEGTWHTVVDDKSLQDFPPDYGPLKVSAESGVCCIGSVPWVVNFNILLDTNDLQLAKSVAKVVSQRAGGLDGVEAMALHHAEGCEVACNILKYNSVSTNDVEDAVTQACKDRKLNIVRSYRIGKTPEELIQTARQFLSR